MTADTPMVWYLRRKAFLGNPFWSKEGRREEMIHEMFLQPLIRTEGYRQLVNALPKSVGKPAAVFGLTEGAKVVVSGALSRGRRTLVVTSSEQSAMRMAEDLQRLGVEALHFPARDMTLYHMAAESRELIQRRIMVLGKLLLGQTQVVVAPVEALLIPLTPKAEFQKALMRFEPGDILDLEEMALQLSRMGYERSDMVEAKGQFAIRGGILDIYPVQSMTAYRIEMFDDEVDSVRELDVMTQRSNHTDDPCEIYPATEAIAGAAEMSRAAQALKAELAGLKPSAKKAQENDLPWMSEDEDGAIVQRRAVIDKEKCV